MLTIAWGHPPPAIDPAHRAIHRSHQPFWRMRLTTQMLTWLHRHQVRSFFTVRVLSPGFMPGIGSHCSQPGDQGESLCRNARRESSGRLRWGSLSCRSHARTLKRGFVTASRSEVRATSLSSASLPTSQSSGSAPGSVRSSTAPSPASPAGRQRLCLRCSVRRRQAQTTLPATIPVVPPRPPHQPSTRSSHLTPSRL